MASELTLGDLKTQALDAAELTSGYIVDARLDDYANYALARLHDVLMRADPWYFKKEKDYTIASGTENYALPDDFYKELGTFFISGSDRIPLQRYNPRVSADFRAPNQSGTVRLYYTPQFKKLTADNQVIHPVIPVGYERFVVLSAAKQCLVRAKLDHSVVASELAEEEARIVEMAEPRGWGDSIEIEDVYTRFAGGARVYQNGLRYAIIGLNLSLVREWPFR